MNYDQLTDEQVNNLYDYSRNELRSLNPSALKSIQKQLDACQNTKEQLKLLSRVIKDETQKLKSLRNHFLDQLMLQYPDAYADIEDLLEGSDYITQIETIKDIIAYEKSKQTHEPPQEDIPQSPQQHTPIMFNDSQTHMTQQRWQAPSLFDESPSLVQARNRVHDILEQYPPDKKDLDKAISDIAMHRSRTEGMRRNITPEQLEGRVKYGKTGMGKNDLQHILLDLKQDIKQIKEAQSVNSANNWINKHRWNDRLEVVETDLNGDDIPEVVVRTRKGQKPVIINGYTTVDSTFPYRNAYYSTYPTRESRKGRSLNEFVKDMYQPNYDKYGRNLVNGQEYLGQQWAQFEDYWHNKPKGYTVKLNPGGVKKRGRSSYQAFVAKCITPIYQAIKYISRDFKIPKTFNLMKLAKIIWEQFALIPSMVAIYGSNIGAVESKQVWDNLRNKPEVKRTIDRIIEGYLESPLSIVEFIPSILEMAILSGMDYIPRTNDSIAAIVKATYLIIDHRGKIDFLPPYADFSNFYNTKLEPEKKALIEHAIQRAINTAENGPSVPESLPSIQGEVPAAEPLNGNANLAIENDSRVEEVYED